MANRVVKLTVLAALVAFIVWLVNAVRSGLVSDPFNVED
uniref:Uncharacterized protein n=1 Tax=Streptomyces phage Scarif TaxID=3158858 RepID=A0AAU7GY75_9CAUD